MQAYGKDPLCQFSFTLGAYKELFSLLKGVSNERWAEQVPNNLPILLISGQEDPVGQYGKGVQQVSHWLTQTGHTKVDLKLYPGARHEVLNESNRHEVYTDMMNWILRWC